jgi:hypothetical protein
VYPVKYLHHEDRKEIDIVAKVVRVLNDASREDARKMQTVLINEIKANQMVMESDSNHFYFPKIMDCAEITDIIDSWVGESYFGGNSFS